jgi:hypothetical protein
VIRLRLLALAAAFAVGLPGAVAATSASVDARVRVSPLLVTLTLSTDSAQTGQALRAEATLTNVGATTLRSIRVELRADRAGLVIQDPISSVSQLRAGRSVTLAWSVCGRQVGSYVLLVRATAAGVSIDSQARVLAIVPGGRRSCS